MFDDLLTIPVLMNSMQYFPGIFYLQQDGGWVIHGQESGVDSSVLFSQLYVFQEYNGSLFIASS